MSYQKERADRIKARRELYAKHRAMGKCVRCSDGIVEEGFTSCPTCREKMRLRERRYKARKKYANDKVGVCITCMDRDAMPNRRHCAVCAERRDASNNKSRDKRRALGLCIRCKAKAVEGRAHCQRCLDNAKEKANARRAK